MNELIETTGWETVTVPMATSSQRRALYRLGVAKSLVAKMSVDDADKTIKAMIQLRQTLGPLSAGPTATDVSKKTA